MGKCMPTFQLETGYKSGERKSVICLWYVSGGKVRTQEGKDQQFGVNFFHHKDICVLKTAKTVINYCYIFSLRLLSFSINKSQLNPLDFNGVHSNKRGCECLSAFLRFPDIWTEKCISIIQQCTTGTRHIHTKEM